MAKINIKFNNKNYSIDKSLLADATARLEAHLASMMEERLEGDGGEYYTLAPTPLSFRSTAPLNELQEVQINGVTVDPSNYTLEEGSTIVTFPIDYLKTLNVGNYEVNVVSESKTVKGGFTIAAPELNEFGFYYNQPYTAYVPYYGEKVAFIFREDGSGDFLLVSSGYTEIVSFTSSTNAIVLNGVAGTFNAIVSSDGTEVYCVELDTTFKLYDESIIADGDYIYTYKEDLGGYEVTVLDKTKAEYGAIKTGINGINTVKLANVMFAIWDNGKDIVSNAYLTTIPSIPDSVTTIGIEAFRNCAKLIDVIIPNNITTIEAKAFYWCRSLTDITIGSGVTSIGDSAFGDCVKLTNIVFEGTTEQWDAITKGSWHYGAPATYVQCSDGQVAL